MIDGLEIKSSLDFLDFFSPAPFGMKMTVGFFAKTKSLSANLRMTTKECKSISFSLNGLGKSKQNW